MKNYLRTQITLYEEDKNYPIWRRQERRSKYAVQLASWQLRSNSPKMSVRLSHLFDYVPLIVSSWNFQELLLMTKVRSMQKVKVRGQRSRSEVTTQLNRFRTVTPVWILIWWWNDAYSLMLLRRGALLFFKVIRQISMSHGSKNRQIWPRLGVSGL